MILKEVVKIRNPIAYNVIENAYKNNKISQNYLIYAFYALEVDYFVYFIAQVLLCKNGFACGNCNNCNRVLNKTYIDLHILDGSKTSIKKDDILNVQHSLSQTALEDEKIKILLIKNIENMSNQGHNTLLKMIEEPKKNTYIIASTNNINKLPLTILSRNQIIHLFKSNRDVLIGELVDVNFKEDDAYILSNIFQSFNTAKRFHAGSYFEYKKAVIDFFYKWTSNKNEGKIYLLNIDYKTINLKDFLRVFVVFLNDIWRENENKSISFKNDITLLNKLNKLRFPVYKCIDETNKLIIKINNKLNLKLQIYSWVFKMFEGDIDG